MDSEQMKIFLAVADCGSFTKAETTCFLSKQAMIKQVQRLEDEIGCSLFTKSRHGVSLTEEGKLFYQGAVQILNEEKQLILSILKKSGKDVLRVGSAQQHQILLDRVTSRFALLYPQITIQKTIHPNHSGEFRIENRIQDVAESFLGDEPVEKLPYAFQKLADFPYVVVMDPKHPLSSYETLSLAQLSDYPVTTLKNMLRQEYVEEIQNAYQDHPERLTISFDFDHQVELVYQCLHTNHLIIGANPFLYQIDEVKKIPLDTNWKRTYGIIYPRQSNWMIQKYVELAVQLYQAEPFDFSK